MRAGFEGGQTTIYMRLGKLRGATSKDAMPIGPFRTYMQPVNIRDLDRFDAGDEVTPETLVEKRLIKNTRTDVKLLGVGEVTKKLTVRVHAISASAREKIEGAGGTVELLREPKVKKVRHRKAKPVARRRARGRSRRAARGGRRRRGRRPRRPQRPTKERRTRCSWLTNAWRVPELRRRLLFTAGILAVYRLGSWIPAPGVDQKALAQFFGTGKGSSGVLSLLNLFSGSALSRFSLFALGIMPYVTASIIFQVMAVVVPSLERLQKEGEAGYAKITQYTRYLTVVLAAAQSTGYAFLFKQSQRADERQRRAADHHHRHAHGAARRC